MKIDCSKTENYFKEKGRMLESIKSDCSYCILASKNNGTGFLCCIFEGKHSDKAISVVQKWSDEHPQKTYKEDFLEKFPNAPTRNFGGKVGYPKVKACNCYSELKFLCSESTTVCSDCWDKVMEE